MANVAWPAFLKPIASAYVETGNSGLRRTEYDDGFVAQKPKQSRQFVDKSIACLVESREDRLAFKTWYRSLQGGANWIDYYDPDDREIIPVRIKNGEYQIQSLRADKYRISFTVETWELIV